jgi:transcriptional regulator with XRE-family HTH domain
VNNLRRLRARSGMTQEELARRAGISRVYLARLESGQQDPRVSIVVRLAQALDVSTDMLMNITPSKEDKRTMAPARQHFEDALEAILAVATREGRAHLDVKSGDLHRRVGGYPGAAHRMPVCCAVMEARMIQGDRILAAPPKGRGATLLIRYNLPRR